MYRGVCIACVLAAALGAIARADIAHYHMHRQLEDLRALEQYLVEGELSQAKALAFLLTMSTPERHLPRRSAEASELVAAASKLSSARTLDEALRLEVRVVGACAACHEAATTKVIFPMPDRPPLSDHTSWSAWRARHRWATDRMREGMIGNSEDHWRAGLAVLAETSPPITATAKSSRLAVKLQQQATRTLREPPPETSEERGRMYGTMLPKCVACHASVSDEEWRPAP